MEREGLVLSEWRMLGKRRRKDYAVTAEGRQWLEASTAQWNAFARQLVDFAGKWPMATLTAVWSH
jgi:DNA-binding PadR family transcriptional regulator